MNKAAFFDRDGVLNKLVRRDGGLYSPRKIEDFALYEESIGVVSDLKKLGFNVFVVSNQPDVSRGLMSNSDLKKMTLALMKKLVVDEVYYCIHDDWEGCDCRKPLPGLINRAAKEYDIDLDRSFYVGDTWRDVEAAKNARVRCLLLNRDYNQDILCDKRISNIKEIIQNISEG